MTRDELLHQVALAIMGIDTQQKVPMPHHLQYAENVLSTIFAALHEPTEEMTGSARHLIMWLHNDRPTEHWLKFWCERRGLPVPEGCEDIDHVPPKAQQAAWVFQAMLAASPLAPEGGKD